MMLRIGGKLSLLRYRDKQLVGVTVLDASKPRRKSARGDFDVLRIIKM